MLTNENACSVRKADIQIRWQKVYDLNKFDLSCFNYYDPAI